MSWSGARNMMQTLCELQPPSTRARLWRMALLPRSWGSMP